MPRRNVLLVDIPSYPVAVPSPYRELLERRLKAQSVLSKERIGFTISRPALPYSRGLLLIAAYLEQQGHFIRYLIYPDSGDARQFMHLCKEADVIGFTAMTPVVQQVFALCRQAKALRPSALCVLGGPHARTMARRCLEECPELDVVITGAGELSFAQLVDRLESYRDVPGITYRQATYELAQNQLQEKQPRATVEMPGPAYHLLRRPLATYAHNIRTFSGCPYKCNFCFERLSWHGRRGHNSLQRVVDEIRLVSQGAAPQTLIHFSDSIFTLDKERTLELCSLLAKAQLPVVFSCDTRVDHVDREVVQAMAEARFVSIRLGVEDLDDDVLQSVKKDIVADQSLRALEIIRSAAPHMLIHAYMLTGLPGSTMATLGRIARTIPRLIQQRSVDVIGNKVLVPYPGTPYFESPWRHQMELLHQNWSKYDRLSLPVYRLANLTEYQIYFGFLTLESILLQAYETRIANALHIAQAPPESLDYVYRCYVQQIGPQAELHREKVAPLI